jgi:uncharacterized membrane protein
MFGAEDGNAMITTWSSEDGSLVRIQARGNFSLDAGGLVNLLLALSVVTFCLAAALAWQGYWPILLIAVLQIALVAWILVRTWEQTWVCEVIEIQADRIEVTHQRHKSRRQCELDTAWAVVELKRPEVKWYGPRLQLRSGARSVELGSFLTVEEKHLLLKQVKTAIEKHSAMKGALNF